jgi:hypothetical protein
VRLFQSQITPQGVHAVFVTHLHSDHTTDFADLLVMGWVGGREAPLPVWGPAGTAKMVAAYRSALDEDTKFRFAHHGDKLPAIGPAAEVTEIEVGIEPQVVATIGDITVKAFEVDHRPVMPAYGFRFEREGKSIVISGDTNPCPGLANGARDADILVVDSMNKKMMAQLEERLRGIGNPKQADIPCLTGGRRRAGPEGRREAPRLFARAAADHRRPERTVHRGNRQDLHRSDDGHEGPGEVLGLAARKRVRVEDKDLAIRRTGDVNK